MKIIRDERSWQVRPTLDNIECPYLYYPANVYACDFKDRNRMKNLSCNMDTCLIRVETSKHGLTVDMDFIHGWRNNIRYALEIHQGYCQAREYDWDTNLDKSLITMLQECGVEIKEEKDGNED